VTDNMESNHHCSPLHFKPPLLKEPLLAKEFEKPSQKARHVFSISDLH